MIFVIVSSYYLDCLFCVGDKLTFVQKDMPLLELSSQQVRKHNNWQFVQFKEHHHWQFVQFKEKQK